jgi:hypothetical protein
VGNHSRSHSARREVSTVTIPGVRAGRAHAVPDVQIAGPQADGRGRYVAMCGYVVTAAPMIEPEGAPCPLCSAS